MKAYYRESLASAAEDCGLIMTDEQLDFMADAMKGSHECYGLYSGNDFIPNPGESQARNELEKLKREISQKQAWINSTEPCKTCKTTGTTLDGWGRNSDCPNCGGRGRVSK